MSGASSEYAVEMRGITKRFGSFYALQDMELRVKNVLGMG